MARRKLSPEDQKAHALESLRIHAFLFCQEAGIPREALAPMFNGWRTRKGVSYPEYAFIDHREVDGGFVKKGTFVECEAWICAARNGVAIVNRHNGLKHGRGCMDGVSICKLCEKKASL